MHAQLCLTPCDLMDFSPRGSFLFLEFSRQEYWSGLPFPTLKYLPDLGIEPKTLVSSALAGGFLSTMSSGKLPPVFVKMILFGSRGFVDAIKYRCCCCC